MIHHEIFSASQNFRDSHIFHIAFELIPQKSVNMYLPSAITFQNAFIMLIGFLHIKSSSIFQRLVDIKAINLRYFAVRYDLNATQCCVSLRSESILCSHVWLYFVFGWMSPKASTIEDFGLMALEMCSAPFVPPCVRDLFRTFRTWSFRIVWYLKP